MSIRRSARRPALVLTLLPALVLTLLPGLVLALLPALAPVAFATPAHPPVSPPQVEAADRSGPSSGGSAAANPPLPSYTLEWTEESFPHVQVEARIVVQEGVVRTQDFWGSFFEGERGWAGFIDLHTALDEGGRTLTVKRGEGPTWHIGSHATGPVTLRYRVDFSFAHERWAAGNEQVALAVDGGLYTTGLPLFVYSGSPSNIRVRIVAPGSWQVTTAWPRIDEQTYLAADLNRLTRNTLAVGRFREEVFNAGSFELRLALLGEPARAADLVRETLTRIFDFYVRLYAPGASQFMIAVIPGPNDGEAYFDSFASSMPGLPTLANRVVWAGSLAHEFGHYWNGKRFSTTHENRAERQWFSEGATEYLANRVLLETGTIDEATYREVLASHLTVHLVFAHNPLFEGVSMRQAGASKWRYRPGVYDSGAAAAFCLDGLIREGTGGKRTLLDLMRLMDARFGATARPYVHDDLARAASEVAGVDLSPFFERHVSGEEPLPVAGCAEKMSYQALVDGYHVYLR